MSHIQSASELIKKYEGLRLASYKCPAGIWTIGWGHTGRDIIQGIEIDIHEAESYLMDDIREANECIDNWVDVELSDNQRAALVSFIFNLGCGNFRNSTLLKLINAKQFDAAAKQFGRWTKANGVELAGLVHRRQEERDLFERA